MRIETITKKIKTDKMNDHNKNKTRNTQKNSQNKSTRNTTQFFFKKRKNNDYAIER